MTFENRGRTHTYLVDASVYIFRAFFSLPSSLTNNEGRPINALYGFCRFIIELLQNHKPTAIAVAFDESLTTSFRNEIYPPYKANRDEPPDELIWQLSLCRRFTELAGIASFASPVYEADDIIGALAAQLHRRGKSAVIVTRDKDLLQLLQPGDFYLDYAATKWIGYENVKGHIGVRAEQVAEFLALTGDSVDNIPGVPGIGKKTAAAILDAFETIAEAKSNPTQLAALGFRGAKKIPEKLDNHQEDIALALSLTQIPQSIDMDLPLESLVLNTIDKNKLQVFMNELGVGKQMRTAINNL
ncbi:MAG: 5'-3' exonuclease H3TH domain-containing protein [Pseudomonadota bacterium]